ncbi:hypothetical protein LEP1GSC069_2677 [Leptospira interrogans serovar Canicola str. Fiocruz LV133]|nr:hypothetical protein LEP1GSC069_2677 [Leptospira interrogans serovar Canicola str. Fiocruz LV133]
MGTIANHDFTDQFLKCGNYYFQKIPSHFSMNSHLTYSYESP